MHFLKGWRGMETPPPSTTHSISVSVLASELRSWWGGARPPSSGSAFAKKVSTKVSRQGFGSFLPLSSISA